MSYRGRQLGGGGVPKNCLCIILVFGLLFRAMHVATVVTRVRFWVIFVWFFPATPSWSRGSWPSVSEDGAVPSCPCLALGPLVCVDNGTISTTSFFPYPMTLETSTMGRVVGGSIFHRSWLSSSWRWFVSLGSVVWVYFIHRAWNRPHPRPSAPSQPTDALDPLHHALYRPPLADGETWPCPITPSPGPKPQQTRQSVNWWNTSLDRCIACL